MIVQRTFTAEVDAELRREDERKNEHVHWTISCIRRVRWLACMSADGNANGNAARPLYNCAKCPAYCCSYDNLDVSMRDGRRRAKHFGIDVESAAQRSTNMSGGRR